MEYVYKNAPIPGGGYVTGFAFHKKMEGILYARTDIGGVYRYDYDDKRWISLVDHVRMDDLAEVFPIAIALDDDNPDMLYIACGINEEPCGKLCISNDRGRTFTYKSIPTLVHGNLSGRGTGMRLVVYGGYLYFASQKGGLLRCRLADGTWEKLPVPEDYMTFVWVNDGVIVAGSAGVTTAHDGRRGHSLYVSYDDGASFEELAEPDVPYVEGCKMPGLVASRYDYDGKYLYVTMNSTGRWNYIVDMGYSCDTGDVILGRVLRYEFCDGRIVGYKDITPEGQEGYLDYGFGGISSCQSMRGLLACSTLCRELKGVEHIYRSYDYGDTWEVSLAGLDKGGIYFKTSYMQPKYNGKVSILHWQSDVKINPFNPDELWLNSGTGVFGTDAFTTDSPAYHDICEGIEETVHLNVYAPVAGEVKLIDIVGDLGAFAFRALDEPCENSFDDADGNRYITCINGDTSDYDENLAIVTARGNWKRMTKGGLVMSRDNCKTFTRLDMPFGLSERLDEKLHFIEEPNVNAGWVAMSGSGKNIVWAVADMIDLPADLVVSSSDGGKSFVRTKIFDLEGKEVTTGKFKPFSDRVDSDLFYGFGEKSQMYVSVDGGRTFNQVAVTEDFPEIDFGKIDTANKTEVRVESGKRGVIFAATGAYGLWKLVYDGSFKATRLSKEGDSVFRAGLGLKREGGDYINEDKAIYFVGIIDGEYGFYVSFDELASVERINNDRQMFGDINSIDGDKREFGRFFIATGSRGVIYGERAKNN